ncbi:MAG: hypothetical protein DRI90_04780 [Deltaproteobacteria bacterium]|nr:MAG: hypothetical protein DRI90_04780 [Deltaproteobacteria bacterium]
MIDHPGKHLVGDSLERGLFRGPELQAQGDHRAGTIAQQPALDLLVPGGLVEQGLQAHRHVEVLATGNHPVAPRLATYDRQARPAVPVVTAHR